MLRLEDVQTPQEARDFYREVIRNCDIGLVRRIEATPQELPEDCCKVRMAKAAYLKLRSFFGHTENDLQRWMEFA